MNKVPVETSNSTNFLEFNEIDSTIRDKIASVVESNDASEEVLLSPIVEDYVYATNRALDFGDYFGVLDKRALWETKINKNADYFDYTELIKKDADGRESYLSFRDAMVYINHQSKSPDLAIGAVFDTYMVAEPYDDMHLVNLIGVDKKLAPGIARNLATYPTKVKTSMGCAIQSSMCTVCGKEITTQASMCNHLRMHRGRRVNGKIASELLRGIKFVEDSIVTTPACPTALVLDAIAEIVPGRLLKIASEVEEGESLIYIMNNVYNSIKMAKTSSEKKRLISNFDKLIYRLEKLGA